MTVPFTAVALDQLRTVQHWYEDQPRSRKLAIIIASGFVALATVFALIYRETILQYIVSFAHAWNDLPGGKALLFVLLTLVAFPPLIGYSFLSSITGMIFGFPNGWIFLSIATLVGSSCSFLVFRYLLADRAKQLAHKSAKFEAFVQTMDHHGSFNLLWMIRLCPLPYSLSNGALASIHTIKFSRFVLATAITTPKLLIHIFIGDRTMKIGTEKDTASRIVDFVSIAIAGAASSATAYIIYQRTQSVVESYETVDDELSEFDGSDLEETLN